VTSALELAAPMTGMAAVDESGPLLRSKFAVPDPCRFIVPRGELRALLAQGVHEPVTVVTGPAGSGKTQAVAAWVRAGAATDTVAWVTLEESDGEPAVFWTYVIEGLRRAGLPLFPATAEPFYPTAVDQTVLVRLAAQLTAQPRTVFLVLDEVSSVADPRWANDLDFVLRHSDGRLRLVLVGRWDPPLPLYRYRLAGTLSEVRAADLAFTGAETAELLALHGIALTPVGLASLLRHTEGWAAGLRLFAMALEGHDDAERVLATINGDEATIAEYFVGEVLRAQPPDIREFLLKTSILDTITPELAQLLTGRGDTRRMLALLERENVFVQAVDDQPTTYRYHRLFGELLRAELAYDDPEQTSRLHSLAADRLAADGRTVDAVGHAVRAGDWDTAAAIAIDGYAVGQLVLGGRADRLGRLFRDLPEVAASPAAALVAAALAMADHDPGRCAAYLARAEEPVVDRVPGRGTALALAASVLDVLVAGASREAPRALDLAHAVEPLIAQAPPERLNRHPELRVLIRAACGTAQSWTGATGAAAVTLAEAAAVASATGCESLRLDCLQHLALLEAYRGRLRHATALAEQAIELAERCDRTGEGPPATAEVALAWVAVEHYDVDAGWRHLRAAESLCAPGAGGLAEAGFAVVKSRLLRARGEFRGALKVLLDVADADGVRSPPAWLAREISLGRARILIASGHPCDALEAIDQLAGREFADVAVVEAEALLAAGDPDRARQVVQTAVEAADVAVAVSVNAWLIVATIAAERGDVREAHEALRNAIRLAGPESQRRHFHEAGARLRRLMRDDQELAGQYRALGRTAHVPHRAVGESVQPVVVETLSKREMEVLRYVEAMLPTEEIAGAMYVSVNTVKTHVRSILRKLSASRRNEAVRRARELGLI
jgi:LuxR family transcriptional regulator, maltose regulon positive regulatory protein